MSKITGGGRDLRTDTTAPNILIQDRKWKIAFKYCLATLFCFFKFLLNRFDEFWIEELEPF